MVYSGCCAQERHGAIYLSDMAHGKRFTIDLTDGLILVWLTLFSTSYNGPVDWSATTLDGSHIRALKCAAGAQKKSGIQRVDHVVESLFLSNVSDG